MKPQAAVPGTWAGTQVAVGHQLRETLSYAPPSEHFGGRWEAVDKGEGHPNAPTSALAKNHACASSASARTPTRTLTQVRAPASARAHTPRGRSGCGQPPTGPSGAPSVPPPPPQRRPRPLSLRSLRRPWPHPALPRVQARHRPCAPSGPRHPAAPRPAGRAAVRAPALSVGPAAAAVTAAVAAVAECCQWRRVLTGGCCRPAYGMGAFSSGTCPATVPRRRHHPRAGCRPSR